MNKIFQSTLLFCILAVTACAAGGPSSSTSGDYELRSATPGVVDHNVIPKKNK